MGKGRVWNTFPPPATGAARPWGVMAAAIDATGSLKPADRGTEESLNLERDVVDDEQLDEWCVEGEGVCGVWCVVLCKKDAPFPPAAVNN